MGFLQIPRPAGFFCPVGDPWPSRCTEPQGCPERPVGGWAKAGGPRQGRRHSLVPVLKLRRLPSRLTARLASHLRDAGPRRPSIAPAVPCPATLASLLLLLPVVAQPPLGSAWTKPAIEQATAATPHPGISHRLPPGNVEAQKQPAYRLTPERRALLNTIRYAEGTWLGGSGEGYRVLYGGGRFAGFTQHPEIEVRRRYVSAAAGAYQFLPATWKAAARELALPDFGPHNQDQAALHLVRKRGALHHFDREGLSEAVLARLAPEWASLPTLSGGSMYGQPVRSARDLQAFFRRELGRQRRLVAAA